MSWLLSIMLRWRCGCRYLFQLVLFSSDKYPEVGLLDPRIVLFLIFWGTSTLFSLVAAPIHRSYQQSTGFPFLHILPNTDHFLSFWWASFWQVWSDISLWFWFTSPWRWVVLSPFHVPIGHLHVFFGKMSIQILCPFFNQIVCFPAIEWYEFLIYFGY